jgi:REP element-mobilizing transposase RayT
MPRRTRIHINRLPMHIVQRGHNRAACFFDDQARRVSSGDSLLNSLDEMLRIG